MCKVYFLKQGTNFRKLKVHRAVLNSMCRAAMEKMREIDPSATQADRYWMIHDTLMLEYKKRRKLADVSFYLDTIDYVVWKILNSHDGCDKIRLPDRLFDGINSRTRRRLKTSYGQIITEEPFKSLDPGEHARIEILPGILTQTWALVIQTEYDTLRLRQDIFTQDERTNVAAY